ncbi:hypothetical protein NBCG_01657 [Nocardioidaceae bacterium Broad-1]|nr:hypothetical protein NBCG_01657 [Nocardioidaceae bacterium Broad-1]
MTLTGAVGELEPLIDDDAHAEFSGNRALVTNAWAYARFTFDAVNLPNEEEQKAATKRAEAHRAEAAWIAELADDLADDLASERRHGWCSACFAPHHHRKVNRPTGQPPAYLCVGCGSPTVPCLGPGCNNMAVRQPGAMKALRYCAEHRHEIPGFAKADRGMGSLEDYRDFLKYERPNLSRTTKLVGVGVAGLALGAPAAAAAAPAIGGAIGVLAGGYSGAVATNVGLAILGGGSLASGGFGMAGGTLVITALGSGLGGAMSASVLNSYVREDKSFHIEKLRDGRGVPVIVCNGFLSESGRGWGEWEHIVTARYPDAPVYRVHWGAKELKDLGFLVGGGFAAGAGGFALAGAVAQAARAAVQKVTPIAPAFIAANLVQNPWTVAKKRAEKTGVILADLLARSNAESYVLVGHSLGARAMVVAAQTLGTKPGGPALESVHLLGAAIGRKSDWHTLTTAVSGAVYNYHSAHDNVLKYLYAAAELGEKPAGLKGFIPEVLKLKNVDVSADVKDHSGYHPAVILQ